MAEEFVQTANPRGINSNDSVKGQCASQRIVK